MAGFGIAVGCALGCVTHILWATLGVSAVIASSPTLFLALKAGRLGLSGVARHPGAEGRAPACRQAAKHVQPNPGCATCAAAFIANAINPRWRCSSSPSCRSSSSPSSAT